MQAPVSAAIPLAWNPLYARNPEIRKWLLSYDDSAVLEGLCVFSEGTDRAELCQRLVDQSPAEARRWAAVLHRICLDDGLIGPECHAPANLSPTELADELVHMLNVVCPIQR